MTSLHLYSRNELFYANCQVCEPKRLVHSFGSGRVRESDLIPILWLSLFIIISRHSQILALIFSKLRYFKMAAPIPLISIKLSYFQSESF